MRRRRKQRLNRDPCAFEFVDPGCIDAFEPEIINCRCTPLPADLLDTSDLEAPATPVGERAMGLCAFDCTRKVKAPKVACDEHWKAIGERWRKVLIDKYGTDGFETALNAAIGVMRAAERARRRQQQ